MDVKSAFLYGTIDEEVYVCQPHGFEDPQFPNKVYRVEKALYGLHQAPKAWYETLSTYLIENVLGIKELLQDNAAEGLNTASSNNNKRSIQLEPTSFMLKTGNPEILLQDHAVVNSGCSSYMTGNKAYLSDYEDFNGGFVAFGSDPKGGKIMGKGKIKTANLDFDDVYFVDELKFNLFSVS
ncbi:ribonuclease H-like domain-containing protein [Tanacetum coccineum]